MLGEHRLVAGEPGSEQGWDAWLSTSFWCWYDHCLALCLSHDQR